MAGGNNSQQSALYLPDDEEAIRALQARIKGFQIPPLYTDEQQAQIMKGRRGQADIDAGRKTIQDRIDANKKAGDQLQGLNDQLAKLKTEATARFQTSRQNQASDEQSAYDASTRGQIVNALKGYAPPILGAAGGLGAGEGINKMLGTFQSRNADNIAGIASKIRGADLTTPEGRAIAQGGVQAARDFMPMNPLSKAVGMAGRALTYGVPTALLLREAQKYRDQSGDSSVSPAQQEQARMVGNALLGVGTGVGFEGATRFVFPNRPGTLGPDMADILAAKSYLDNNPAGAAALKPSATSGANALTSQAQPDIANALAQWQRQPGANALTLQANPQPALPAPEPTPQTPINPQATAAETTPQSSGLRAPSDRLKAAVASVGGPRGLAKGDAIDFLNDHLGGDNPARGAIARELGVTNGPNLQQRLLDKLEELKTSRKAYGLLGPAGAMIGAGLALGAGSDDANASPLEKAENVAETAAYGLPYVGNALVARDLYRALPSASEQSVVDLADPRAAISPESVQRTYARQNIAAAQAEDARQRNELARTNALNNALSRFAPPGSNTAAVTMAGLPTGAPIPNQLALNGPDGKFYRALQDFQNHFGALKAAGAQANQ